MICQFCLKLHSMRVYSHYCWTKWPLRALTLLITRHDPVFQAGAADDDTTDSDLNLFVNYKLYIYSHSQVILCLHEVGEMCETNKNCRSPKSEWSQRQCHINVINTLAEEGVVHCWYADKVILYCRSLQNILMWTQQLLLRIYFKSIDRFLLWKLEQAGQLGDWDCKRGPTVITVQIDFNSTSNSRSVIYRLSPLGRNCSEVNYTDVLMDIYNLCWAQQLNGAPAT